MFAVAAHQGHRTVLAGAWGCGAFRNDPEVAARTAAAALRDAGVDRVIFAIPGKGRQSLHNLDVFRAVLGA